ncbi:uncharacterized protein LOC111706401 [Eurytemora carolleeae]|uniref:uncharacterized protein LOC111706401 n=1 Tax=Eurytemora carolleeae TaxID=1294199 RepID=UPI000C76D760|nr:uncharacterized protein LOC111706401 [Eurytemora carolleeae]|eukprot:XP_023335041.1 uncharacterized protein LOC111706401 [Eurytemora affinis]
MGLKGGPGRIQSDREVFDFTDSRFVDPLPETKFNKPLEELEFERAVESNRLLPGGFPSFSTPRQPFQVQQTGSAFNQPLTPFVHTSAIAESPRQSSFQGVQSRLQGVQSRQNQGVQPSLLQQQTFQSFLPEANFASFAKISRSIPQGSYSISYPSS